MLVSDLITRALVLSGVLQAGRAASAYQMEEGVDALNDMLAQWAQDGVDLAQPTLTQTATIYAMAAHLRAIRYNLAVELATHFGVEISAPVAIIAQDSIRALRNSLFEIDNMTVDNALTRPATDFDFTNG